MWFLLAIDLPVLLTDIEHAGIMFHTRALIDGSQGSATNADFVLRGTHPKGAMAAMELLTGLYVLCAVAANWNLRTQRDGHRDVVDLITTGACFDIDDGNRAVSTAA